MPAVEAFGGDVLPTAWIIPLGQDGLIGITAPFIVYLLATKPRALTYVIGIAWVWWGITDFGVGLATEIFQPPLKSPFGPHTPNAMMKGWLFTNLILELFAFYLMLTAPVRQYFMASENENSLSIKESPLKGKWIFVIVVAFLMGIFFKNVTGGMDGLFELMGFPVH